MNSSSGEPNVLAFGRSICEEEVSSGELSSPILDKKRMKKKRFHNHIQWLESWIIAITAEIKMGRKLRKTTTDAVAEIVVVSCSRGGLWRGEDTRGMRREIEPVV
ncbi:hypothetical protein Bca52824_075099 [Brassica carinata]|uniref:Uncharacterized protein n=1 Tax=Brassica carinata TaxID=52824 RepID=A0A8X7PR79_BRACI|nr:hypothetical protein Bca52824_075099 [Brassica carinata]